MRCDEGKYLGTCLYCYAGVRGRATYRGHSGYRAPRKAPYSEEGTMKRPIGVDVAVAGAVSIPEGGSLLKGCSPLWEFLAHVAWDDGVPRQPGTILFTTEDGIWKAWLHDREGAGRSVWVSAASWDGVLKAAAKAVDDAATPWRRDKAQAAKRRGG